MMKRDAWGGPSIMVWGGIGLNQKLRPVVFQNLGPENLTPFGNASQNSNNNPGNGNPEYAFKPPISNEYSLGYCSHSKEKIDTLEMSGFKVYVTNTSTFPPIGYLCYEEPSPGIPNITQTILYVTLPFMVGCEKNFWGSNCNISCAESCIEKNCFPGNGSCIWEGCSDKNCLNSKCDHYTSVCTEGCKERRAGNFCNKCCPPTHFGPFCSKLCPMHCSGPCDLETGNCIFGCVNRWLGDKCDLDPSCYETISDNLTTNCLPLIYQVYPESGPINGGTLLTLSGIYLGNVNDSILVDISGESNILEFYPKKGILSGNTAVTIRGLNIDFEGQSRYNISFCDDLFCIECSVLPKTISPTLIKCKTDRSVEPRNMTELYVVIDDLTVLTLKETFQYLPDPTFNLSTKLPKALQGGGVVFTIRGNGFNNVGAITVERVGKNILNVARREDYHINIGLDGICLITDISMYNITCYPPTSVPRTNKTDENTVLVIVNVIKIKVYIGDLQYKTETITENSNTFVMVVGILAARVFVSIIIGMSAVLVLRRKKTKTVNEFKMEIKAKEEMIQKARREGLSERIENLRGEDRDAYTEPDESVYDEINADEENSLDANDGYDELGQRSPKNPYNQLQQTRAESQRQDKEYNEINADAELQSNKHSDYLNICDGYEKPISRNDPYINQLQQVLHIKGTEKS
ncbi:unnamed protein product [Mytilus coruscus]|uniref:IPT/TIG domain-containing protein n=1 Tax=Mytilus coruscus TaxID=42192 RepID=A0A6J7ZZZ0_MYTCO|nr:unnamed protein product [Mytilus coruscus]